MDFSNRRSEPRLEDNVTVFVEIRAADPGNDTPAEILVCSGVDLSANGLQVQLDRPLPVGGILRLGAHPRGATPVMYVVGEVRWVRRAGNAYAVGFSFFDSDGTDIIAWKEFIASRLLE